MKKTQLFVTLKNNGVYFTPYEKETSVIDTDGHTRTHRTQLYSMPYAQTQDTQTQYTDLFFAVCEKYVPQLVYTALKTTYAKSPTEKIRMLMNECIDYAKSKHETHEQFEQYLASDNNIITYLPQTATEKERMKQLEYAHARQTTYTKEHTYTMCVDMDGHKHKKECIPFITTHKTRYGMEIEKEHIANGTDIEDLIQIGFLAMVELCNYGLIACVSDLWNYRTYVYKRVNNYIMSERTQAVKNDSLYVYDEDGNESIVTIKSVDRQLAKVERDSAIESIEHVLVNSLDKQANKENILYTFRMLFIFGKDTRTIASDLHVAQTQVMRYKKSIEKALNTPQIYTALNECINA